MIYLKLAASAMTALAAMLALVAFAWRGERFGKKRAYMMAVASALFFGSIFAGAGAFFDALENARPSRPFSADISSDVSSLSLRLGDSKEIELRVENRGSLPWDSADAENPVFLSWHILNDKGNMIRFDNQRVPFGSALPFGGSENVVLRVSPSSDGIPAGRYIFEFDVLQENVTWFADRGSKTCRVQLEVLP